MTKEERQASALERIADALEYFVAEDKAHLPDWHPVSPPPPPKSEPKPEPKAEPEKKPDPPKDKEPEKK